MAERWRAEKWEQPQMTQMGADKKEILKKVTSGPYVWCHFWCPGCKSLHPFYIANQGRATWSFNGDFEKPTFAPSLLCNPTEPEKRCHLFVRDGRIEFLSDCFHELRGKTVPMEPIPSAYGSAG
jgi:hypothetical protein